MKPTFKDIQAWEQAQLLMQPAYIRVVDNLRKQLEKGNWKGNYEKTETPLPGDRLILTHKDCTVTVDLWSLCFQICFRNYNRDLLYVAEEDTSATSEVEIDTNLIDETGDVDWEKLEAKTKQTIETLFANLPSN
ncbi:MAG: hypothetical protein SAL07_24375 [Oscillatoria sp. PMC 1051.18]|uniref:hypothetical protein n=1 Tax=Oscillatoria salina TaxID=331517 RepID=UPI0013B5D500|nr:hypothetical protein [Oscillatoria salina]MBZ8179442.1 hypothetical protein [Oscillatoria salina IIICB1]MEC4896135.1 hypothetical protein [Oscillatoria sp. PMC 1050.18]MEC5033046.1 hypothetical protein [Oscillatoria sp. PMC 1051.18]NET90879.1 hypothetical protein [Kamptonema sp. SIO1D9]